MAALEQALAKLDEAVRAADRDRQLLDGRIYTESDLAEHLGALDDLRAEVERLQHQLEEAQEHVKFIDGEYIVRRRQKIAADETVAQLRQALEDHANASSALRAVGCRNVGTDPAATVAYERWEHTLNAARAALAGSVPATDRVVDWEQVELTIRERLDPDEAVDAALALKEAGYRIVAVPATDTDSEETA